ncbi:MAG: hypothetical protein GQ540_03145, partial [Lutibacter sp.]|uniref:hypothetical protein n=1 Tax=Lutibacter sp. TaxID=1925666 RepID=UPI0019FBA2DE
MNDRELYKRGEKKNKYKDLPNELTCGDCFHDMRCYYAYGMNKLDEVCYFKPQQFIPKIKKYDLTNVPISYNVIENDDKYLVSCGTVGSVSFELTNENDAIYLTNLFNMI